MAGLIGSQPGAVGTSAAGALPLSPSIAGSSTKASSGNTVGKSLSFGGSKEVRGENLFPTSGSATKSKSKLESDGKGTASLQVRATGSSPAKEWITDLFGKIVHPDTKNSGVIKYSGVATISKKRAQLTNLVQLDLVDGQAAFNDEAADLLGEKIEIQLVSVDLDPQTNAPKVSAASNLENWAINKANLDLVADEDYYPVTFSVPKDFGQPGAFIVRNHHPNEFYMKTLRLEAPDQNTIDFPSYAWVHNYKHYPKDRVFFANTDYLPSATPPGLKALREQELEQYRGDGTGERKKWDRIYDYDVYNDLGYPDIYKPLDRIPLGGSKDYPYPRRMRTGRPMSKTDPKTESPIGALVTLPYIPSDEYFLRTKDSTFVAVLLKGVIQAVGPTLENLGSASFKSLDEVKELYNTGVEVDLSGSVDTSVLTPEVDSKQGDLVYLSQLFAAKGEDTSVLNYALPQVFATDENAWRTDEEFGRETLAGLHPTVIQLLKAYPPTSALDPAQYGEGTSLTDKHILPFLEGLSVAQAVKAKKLFIVDYHDAVLPFINQVNADTTFAFKSYAPRAIFFHTSAGTLKPIAIELSLPPAQAGGAASNRVFTPADATDHLWDLAKCHFSAMDSNYHQVISHFTFAHACCEPFIIASYRQLSALHPIKTLLKPYFKDNIPINAAARAVLIQADGIVEANFTMGQHAFPLGAKGYGAFWQFDTQALPQNLLARGMAEPADSSYPGSVKLVIEDYPYAKDGLEIWDAIYKWVAKVVEITYQGSDEAVKADTELQAWWNDIVNVGHGDLKDATWWPKLDSTKNLVQTISTIAWMAGPYHAALNFGQVAYAGYPLNKPSGTRRLVPEKGSAEYNDLQKDPETFFLSTITPATKALIVMTVIELLATHSVDEEYIGTRNTDDWTSDLKVKAAFSEFAQSIAAVEASIKKRNQDPALVNRSGPAVVPYTLLMPTSTSGLTGRGVPNSVSI